MKALDGTIPACNSLELRVPSGVAVAGQSFAVHFFKMVNRNWWDPRFFRHTLSFVSLV